MMTGFAASRAREVLSSRGIRLTTRLIVGGGVLLAIVARVGTGPFLHGLQSLNAPTIGAALVLAAVATAAAAWRWQLIARRLGVGLPWSTAVGMYYQSQFFNSLLPGGVIGDVHRAVAHGRSTENLSSASRAVALERAAGQVVQLALALLVLAFFGAEFEGFLLAAITIGLAALAVAVTTAAALSVRVRRALRIEADELRAGLGSPSASVQAVLASIVVVGCHVATFAIATAAVGASVPPQRMLTLAFVVLLAASVPLNIGGWGPREGMAAWAFALAGYSASAGVAASTLFGVLAIIAIVPGVIATRLVLIITRRNHRDRDRPPLRHPQLRHVPRWLPRLEPSAPARPLERSGPRSGR